MYNGKRYTTKTTKDTKVKENTRYPGLSSLRALRVLRGESSSIRRRGFTLVELMVTMLAAVVVTLGVMNVLANNQKSYNQTYERVYGSVVQDAYAARRIFEQLARKSSIRKCLVGSSNEYAEVYYYSSNEESTAPHLDRYARFYLSGTDLMLERGEIDPATFAHVNGTATTQKVASHVTTAYFEQTRPCLHMHIVLNDGKQDLPVTVTAMRHNE
jgi:prepilin-type N-terminal cleavage/methylation domain-containing protein